MERLAPGGETLKEVSLSDLGATEYPPASPQDLQPPELMSPSACLQASLCPSPGEAQPQEKAKSSSVINKAHIRVHSCEAGTELSSPMSDHS
jgi:hypothetical protein